MLLFLGAICAGAAASLYAGMKTDKDMVVFNFDGSSSMKPAIEFLMNKYAASDEAKNKKIVFNISTIGSNSGLKKLLNGTSEFALVSHDISSYPKSNTYKSDWNSKQLKTITLATEAMIILYKPPRGCDGEITLSKQNINKLYSVFSGFKFPNDTKPIKFSDLLDDAYSSNTNCQVDIHAWVKSTGPMKSGTSKAFVDNPLFREICQTNAVDGKTECNEQCGEWCKKVIESYGNDYQLNYVPESISLHWDSFRNNLRDGSMTYLPSSFVLQNWDEISKLKIKFAKYKKSKDESIVAFTNDLNEQNQEWIRSYNIVYSTSDISTNQRKKDLIEFLVNESKQLSTLKLFAKTYKAADSDNANADPQQISVSEPDKTQ